MSVLDRIRKKGRQDKNVITVEAEIVDNYMKQAEKAAQIVETSISNGDFSHIVQQLESLPSNQKNRVQYVMEAPKTTYCSLIIIVSIVTMAAYLCLGLLGIAIVQLSEAFRNYGLMYAGTAVTVLVVNVVLIRFALKRKHFVKRYNKYAEVLKFRSIELIDDLAAYSGYTSGQIVIDLQKAVKQKLIPEGHFGSDNIVFIMTDEVYEQYQSKQVEFDRYYRKQLEERQRIQERPEKIQEIQDQGKIYIKAIRDSNVIIKDKIVSDKLDRMEQIVTLIFHELDINPGQANKLGKFLNYYLPTTDKLLKAYLDVYDNKNAGNNIRQMRKEIEDALDMLNVSFEKILDQFYEEQEMDIAVDVAVIKSMLPQDGFGE